MSDNVPDCPLCLDNVCVRDNRKYNEGCNWRCTRTHEEKDLHRPPGNGTATWHHFNATPKPNIKCPKCRTDDVFDMAASDNGADAAWVKKYGYSHFCKTCHVECGFHNSRVSEWAFTVKDGAVVEPEKKEDKSMKPYCPICRSRDVTPKQHEGVQWWHCWGDGRNFHNGKGRYFGGIKSATDAHLFTNDNDNLGAAAGEGGPAIRKAAETVPGGGRASHKPPSPRTAKTSRPTAKGWEQDETPRKRRFLPLCAMVTAGACIVMAVGYFGPYWGIVSETDAYATVFTVVSTAGSVLGWVRAFWGSK